MNEEFKFFDDMLACVEQQYTVERELRVDGGRQRGALFTDQLRRRAADRLASFVSLSGGVGATIIKPWNGAGARKLPGVVLWGGDGPPAMDGNKDILGCAGVGMDFSVASRDLESELVADGHFVIECRHNCGHVEPPLEPPPGESKYAGMWEFALNHPFWLPAGQSPFIEKACPPICRAWCAIGAGNATPRTGGGVPRRRESLRRIGQVAFERDSCKVQACSACRGRSAGARELFRRARSTVQSYFAAGGCLQQAVAAQLVDERRARHAERLRGVRLIAFGGGAARR